MCRWGSYDTLRRNVCEKVCVPGFRKLRHKFYGLKQAETFYALPAPPFPTPPPAPPEGPNPINHLISYPTLPIPTTYPPPGPASPPPPKFEQI
jgi:hypothetical protein